MGLRATTGLAATAAIAAFSTDCGLAAGPLAAPPAPSDACNVVLICIDTLRADRLSCNGYGRRTTPEIDALAARGLRFARAYGTAPWTLPSTSSLLCGLQPEVHRATSFLSTLSPDARLLAEALADDGFETAAIVGNYFVTPLFGFARGFSTFNGDCMADRAAINSDKVSDRAIAWLEQPHPRPFLLYLHYFDPHYNYWEHDGFKFGGEDTDRVFSGEDIYELRDHLRELDGEDRARLDSLYDSEVAFTDHHVGRVLRALDERKLAEKTFVVVTADHGEALGEHDWIGHTRQLYDESVRVPLVIAGPGLAPAVIDGDPVQLDDLFSPLLQLARGEGAPGSAAWSSGASALDRGLQPDEALVSVQTAGLDEPGEARPRRFLTHGPWKLFIARDDSGAEAYRLFKSDEPKGKRRKRPEDHPAEMKLLLEQRRADLEQRERELARNRATLTRRRALVKGSWKLIVDEVSGTAELYDLESDPAERRDLAQEQPERRDELRRRLDEIVAVLSAAALRDGAAISSEVADEERRRIEALGYGR